MSYSVLIYPHKGLTTVAQKVEVFDSELKQTVKELLEVMYSHKGVGLAASQVNLAKRIFVMDTSEEQNTPEVLINPEITKREGAIIGSEGCLSFPGLFIEVERAEHITVKSVDESGKSQEHDATGLMARCIQHELDHLDGIVFVDRLSRLKRERALKKFFKLQKINF